MKASIAAAIFAVTASAEHVSAEDFSQSWLDLWTRCRVSLENAEPVAARGLQQTVAPPEMRNSVKLRRYDGWKLWTQAGGRLAILAMERQAVDGGVRRTCDVKLAPGSASPTEPEINAVIRSFLAERASLLAAQTHKVWDPSPIFPMVSLGVGPTKLNLNGCSVVSTLFFDVSSNEFISGSGEQESRPCSGPSKLGDGAETAASR